MKLSHLALGLLSLSGVACGDKSAIIIRPPLPLALGAYAPVRLEDRCGNTGVPSPCATEQLVSLDSVDSDQPDVIEAVATSTLSADLAITAPFVVHALKTGTATVHATGTFSDGSVRTASIAIDVLAISRVLASVVCSPGSSSEAQYALYGTPISSAILLYAGDQELTGERLDVLSGDGLVLSYDEQWETMSFAWQAPSGPGQLVITSPIDPSVHETITTYGPQDVTGLQVGSDSPPLYVAGPSFMQITTSPLVNGSVTCGGYGNLAPIARTETPDVCTGPNGEIEWSGGQAEGALPYQILQEGVCRLSLGVVGGTYVTEEDETVFFVNIEAQDESIILGDACSENGMVSCEPGRNLLAQCVNGSWAIASLCPTDQVCDYVTAGTAQCPGPAACAACRGLR
jgi:hypothetical protein